MSRTINSDVVYLEEIREISSCQNILIDNAIYYIRNNLFAIKKYILYGDVFTIPAPEYASMFSYKKYVYIVPMTYGNEFKRYDTVLRIWETIKVGFDVISTRRYLKFGKYYVIIGNRSICVTTKNGQECSSFSINAYSHREVFIYNNNLYVIVKSQKKVHVKKFENFSFSNEVVFDIKDTFTINYYVKDGKLNIRVDNPDKIYVVLLDTMKLSHEETKANIIYDLTGKTSFSFNAIVRNSDKKYINLFDTIIEEDTKYIVNLYTVYKIIKPKAPMKIVDAYQDISFVM